MAAASDPPLEDHRRRQDSDAATLPPVAVGSLTPATQLPFSFGPYELLEEIGRGGMGVVYRARQPGLDRLVAVKMILGSHLASPDAVARFHTEARAAAKLHHAHIVSVYDTGSLHGLHYIAMQYVEGQSLDAWIRTRRENLDEGIRMLADIARAVHVLHEQGIIHRDLKPSNVLIDVQGQAYLTDFGLAKSLQEEGMQTTTGAVLGTPSYMSPEQAAGLKDLGPPSDVYALGAILYEMLTGRPPFREETALDTLVQVVEGEPVPPRTLNPRVPQALEWICLKCLEKQPGQRYFSAAALAEDLDRYLGGDEVDARPASMVHRLGRWARREPALASRLGALVVIALIVQVSYHLLDLDGRLHAIVLGLMGIWAAASVAWWCLFRRAALSALAPFVWVTTDVLLLTLALHWTGDEFTPLVGLYLLLIVAAGLWFRDQVVWFATLVSAAAYVWLIAVAARPAGGGFLPHHNVIFLALLGVCGLIVTYQVHRVRVLSRYYTQRQGTN